jgi:hypothetical protein
MWRVVFQVVIRELDRALDDALHYESERTCILSLAVKTTNLQTDKGSATRCDASGLLYHAAGHKIVC